MVTLVTIIIVLYVTKVIIYFTMFRENKSNVVAENKVEASVSIIIPMHNEEKVIIRTIQPLLCLKDIEILLIDDGSTDDTVKIISPYVKLYDNIKLYKQPNQGKSSALNLGIKHSRSDIIICIDADTYITSSSIYSLLNKFSNEKVVAVSGNLRGININNFLTRLQDVEYISIYNFEREVFSRVNGITIVPGAIGAFKRNIIQKIGGYNSGSLTEDIDLVLKLRKNGFKIDNSKDSIAFTELPENINMYIRQRVRWKTGLILNMKEYLETGAGDFFFKAIILPYIIVFRIILSLFIPFIDIYFIYALFEDNLSYQYLYLIFTIIDNCIISYILIKQKHFRYVIWTPIQRVVTRQLSLLINIYIIYYFIVGKLFIWRRCKRYGDK